MEFKKEGQIALITFKGSTCSENPFSLVANDFGDACSEIASDETLRVLVILGQGENAFRAVETGHEPCETPSTPKVAQVAGSLDIPVLIGMDGHVLGQGLELALASDIRIATPESYFGFHEINAGLIPSQGGTQRLPRLVGKAKALEMILTGEVVDAYAGQQIGLVHRILKRDDLASGTMALAREMATKSPTSLRYTKEAINKGMDLTLEQGLRLEADLYYLIHTTQDRVEGITAYREKRKPEFTGG